MSEMTVKSKSNGHALSMATTTRLGSSSLPRLDIRCALRVRILRPRRPNAQLSSGLRLASWPVYVSSNNTFARASSLLKSVERYMLYFVPDRCVCLSGVRAIYILNVFFRLTSMHDFCYCHFLTHKSAPGQARGSSTPCESGIVIVHRLSTLRPPAPSAQRHSQSNERRLSAELSQERKENNRRVALLPEKNISRRTPPPLHVCRNHV